MAQEQLEAGGYRLKVLLIGINAKFIHVSLAVYTLAAACREAGHTVDTVEYTINQEFLQVYGDIIDRSPDVVGFACYLWNRGMVGRLAAALKKVLPGLVVVVGGPEASGDATSMLSEYPAIDFVVQGEGEETLPELLHHLANPSSSSALIAGVAFRTAAGICLGGGVRRVKELERLPFPYNEQLLESFRNRIVYYESSRGCPFACSYCVSGAEGDVRRRSLAQVKQELALFLNCNTAQVKFVDRTFNAQPEHYREIWRFLLEQPGSTGFHFEIVAELLQEADLQLLATAPAEKFQFEIGIQSTHPATLAAIGRKSCHERLARHVERIGGLGNIHLHLDLIAGLPEEDLPSFAASFNAVYALRPEMLQIGFLKLLPGTRLRQEAEKYDYIWLDEPPYEVLANRCLDCHDVRRLKILEEVFNQTYNSRRFVHTLSYLVKICTGNDAFEFYQRFSQWWHSRQWSGAPQSPDGVLNRLAEYAAELPAEQKQWVLELLKADVLLEGRQALKGERLDWNGENWAELKNALWRNETALRGYCPEYAFTNWRDVKRRYPIEVFAVPVAKWILTEDATSTNEVSIVLFARDARGTQLHCLNDGVARIGDSK